MYNITFVDADRELYEGAFQAIALGDPPQPSEWDDYLALMRKLKAAGVPSDKVGKVQLYTLAQDFTLELERGEARILKERIERPIWTPEGLERAVRLRDIMRSVADENGAKL